MEYLASSITRNSMPSHGIYFPVKSSQQQYQKFYVHSWDLPWDLHPSEIQPVALPQIPCTALGFIPNKILPAAGLEIACLVIGFISQ
jgi:hypothetical protein